MVIVIGDASLARFLTESGIPAQSRAPEEVPSLTALLLREKDASAVVLTGNAAWSEGHILSAAQYLRRRGGDLYYCGGEAPSAHIPAVSGREELPGLLRKKKPGGSEKQNGNDAGGGKRGGHPEPEEAGDTHGREAMGSGAGEAVPQPADRWHPEKLADIPEDASLVLTVIGAQPRVGCTTQAIQACHYCRELGFDAAVVMHPDDMVAVTKDTATIRIPGGFRAEGIDFVSAPEGTHNCYILDAGVPNSTQAVLGADHVVVVGGAKPWEQPHTVHAAAMVDAAGKAFTVILTFATRRYANATRERLREALHGEPRCIEANYFREVFARDAFLMQRFDRELRPAIETALGRMHETDARDPLRTLGEAENEDAEPEDTEPERR